MKTLRAVLIILSAASGAAAYESQAAKKVFYHFTPLADTQTGIFSLTPAFPAINNQGDVAFRAVFPSGGVAILTRSDAGTFKVIADDTGGLWWILSFVPVVDGIGNGFFMGRPGPLGSTLQGIYRGNGGQLVTVVDNAGAFDEFTRMDVNEIGQVAFTGTLDDERRVVRLRSGSTTVMIATEGTGFAWLGQELSLDDYGNVSFIGTRLTGQHGIYRRWGTEPIYTLVDDSGPFEAFGSLDVNASGKAATFAALDTGARGLFVIENGATIPLAYEGGTLSWIGPFSINAAGTVAWAANFNPNDFGFSQAVFDGAHLAYNRVVGTGDVLFGRTVLNSLVGPNALNDAGEMIITLQFVDGSQMLTLATPFGIDADSLVPDQDLQLTTATGSGVSAVQLVPNPGARANLEMDVRFLSEGGSLEVRIDGVVVHQLRATVSEEPTHVVVALDLPRPSSNATSVTFELALAGAPGFTARLDDVRFPGLANGDFAADGFESWRVDSRQRGSAAVVYGGESPAKGP